MSPATRMRPMPCEPCARAAVKWLLSHPPPNALNVMPRVRFAFSGVRIDRSKKRMWKTNETLGGRSRASSKRIQQILGGGGARARGAVDACVPRHSACAAHRRCVLARGWTACAAGARSRSSKERRLTRVLRTCATAALRRPRAGARARTVASRTPLSRLSGSDSKGG